MKFSWDRKYSYYLVGKGFDAADADDLPHAAYVLDPENCAALMVAEAPVLPRHAAGM